MDRPLASKDQEIRTESYYLNLEWLNFQSALYKGISPLRYSCSNLSQRE